MSETILKLQNLSAGYGGHNVLSRVSLEVRGCDFLGVVGPNGGGKTTLLKVILGLLKPSEGSLEYFRNGVPCRDLRIGYMPQQAQIDRSFPITVRDTILSGLNVERRLFRSLTEEQRRRGLSVEERLGLREIASRPIGQLSGGQWQRTLLGRAMVSNPELLVLDEPDAYVDNFFGSRMYSLLAEMNSRCAVILVSHDMESVMRNVKKIVYVDRSLESLPAESAMQKFKARFSGKE